MEGKLLFFNLVMFYNCLFMAGHLNQNPPSPFFFFVEGGDFTCMANRHDHNTMSAIKKLVNVPLCKTTFYDN